MPAFRPNCCARRSGEALQEASAILVHLSGGEQLSLAEMNTVTEAIKQYASAVDLVVGASGPGRDEALQVTVVIAHQVKLTEVEPDLSAPIESQSSEVANVSFPETFMPSPGTITEFHAPGGPDVRVDSAAYAGYKIPPHYDSMIGKLIVHGRTRNECVMRLRRALDEMVIGGIQTTLPLHQRLVEAKDVVDGNYDIHWLERFLANS